VDAVKAVTLKLSSTQAECYEDIEACALDEREGPDLFEDLALLSANSRATGEQQRVAAFARNVLSLHPDVRAR
jgi:hypothetical protein